MRWDYIIIGAGSAGCAAAHELVKAGRSVLVLEAGGTDRSPFIQIPAGTWKIPDKFDWFVTAPDPSRHNIVEKWKRGRILGAQAVTEQIPCGRGAEFTVSASLGGI